MRRIGFVTAPDGLGLAYGVHGSGPAIVKAANWMTHLEHDWQSPVWRHWLEVLAEHHTVVRYDERGCGLSDRDAEDAFTLERWVSDLEAVVDAAAVDRFALLGISQGAALAVAYAVRHPERVSHLVRYGGYRPRAGGRAATRSSASSPISSIVLHARGDAVVPFAEGRLLATLIPNARFVPLDGRNHILLANEPAWPGFVAETDGFLERPDAPAGWDLSLREQQILGWWPKGWATRRSRRDCS